MITKESNEAINNEWKINWTISLFFNHFTLKNGA